MLIHSILLLIWILFINTVLMIDIHIDYLTFDLLQTLVKKERKKEALSWVLKYCLYLTLFLLLHMYILI